MLSDRDRATLQEIQRRFLAEDPEFVQVFENRTRRLPSNAGQRSAQHGRACTVLLWIGAALGVLLLVLQSASGALLLAVVATVAVGRSLLRRDGGTPAPPSY